MLWFVLPLLPWPNPKRLHFIVLLKYSYFVYVRSACIPQKFWSYVQNNLQYCLSWISVRGRNPVRNHVFPAPLTQPRARPRQPDRRQQHPPQRKRAQRDPGAVRAKQRAEREGQAEGQGPAHHFVLLKGRGGGFPGEFVIKLVIFP